VGNQPASFQRCESRKLGRPVRAGRSVVNMRNERVAPVRRRRNHDRHNADEYDPQTRISKARANLSTNSAQSSEPGQSARATKPGGFVESARYSGTDATFPPLRSGLEWPSRRIAVVAAIASFFPIVDFASRAHPCPQRQTTATSLQRNADEQKFLPANAELGLAL